MKTVQHFVSNGDGWSLPLWRTWDPERLVPGRRPVVIVPGYGMNSFIFSYHPHGLSMLGSLAEAGFEVWRADLRGQGEAKREGGSDDYSLTDLALTDLGVVLNGILEHTETGADRVDVIGASLGGTLMFIHAAVRPQHRMGSLVAMGSPVRWVGVHPLLRILFSSPWLAGQLRLRGTRKFAEHALPLAARFLPTLITIYINPEASDVSAVKELVRTVEDPNRFVNREIAEWIQHRDLVVRGVDISRALSHMTAPFLCVVASNDGIVPRATAEFPYERIGSPDKEILYVGSQTLAMAHADLFIANVAHERVFKPIAAFLARQYPAASAEALH